MIFSTSSLLTQSFGRTDSIPRPEGKAARILGKFNAADTIHIYKIKSENLLGRRSSSRSLEETFSSSSRCSVSDEGQSFLTFDRDLVDTGLEMRQIDELQENMKQVSSQNCIDGRKERFLVVKPKRHMLVIPDRIASCGSLSILDQVGLDYPLVCPSPDSGVHDDFHSPPSTLRNKPPRCLHELHSSSSSPSILNP